MRQLLFDVQLGGTESTTEDRIIIKGTREVVWKESPSKAHGLYFSGQGGKERQGPWGLGGARGAVPAAPGAGAPQQVRGFCSWPLHFNNNRAWLETVQREL